MRLTFLTLMVLVTFGLAGDVSADTSHTTAMNLSDPSRADLIVTEGYDLSGAPDESIVYIPLGVTARVTESSTNRIKDIIVDGTLEVDGRLFVETIWVRQSGSLVVAAENGDEVEIVLTNDEGFNTTDETTSDYDPAYVGHGIIVMGGTIDLQGEAKTTVAKAYSVEAGQEEITLFEAPTNWSAGDRIVIGAVGKDYKSSEVVEVVSVEGSKVTFTPALANDHVLLSHTHPELELSVPVGNLSRNVDIRAESFDQVISRGHIMIMGDHNTDIKYVELEGMGRTQKNKQISKTNVRARYPIHFHLSGPGSAAGLVQGVSVIGSPGWAFVNHNSNVDFLDNVAYGAQGASFVTEASNETGTFYRNGSFHTITPRKYKNHQDFRGTTNFGHQGDGFWLQGLNVDLKDNVVSGYSGNAYAIYGVSIDYPGFIKGGSGSVKNYVERAYQNPPASGYIQANRNHIRLFEDNSAYSGVSALFVWSSSPARKALNTYHQIDGFVAVNSHTGVNTKYAQGTELIDPVFINEPTYGRTGINFDHRRTDIKVSGDSHVVGFASAPAPLLITTVSEVVDPEPQTQIIVKGESVYFSDRNAKVINVLENDSGDELRVVSVSKARKKKGEVTLNPDNTITYTPYAGKKNKDYFTYSVEDKYGTVLSATVSIHLPYKGMKW